LIGTADTKLSLYSQDPSKFGQAKASSTSQGPVTDLLNRTYLILTLTDIVVLPQKEIPSIILSAKTRLF